jgi:MFS family permease
MLLVHSFSGALAVRLLHVVGDSAYLIAQRIAISNLFTPTRIGGNIGILNTTTTFGAFVGALISGIVPGYVYPFVVSGGLSLLGALIFFFLKPDFSPKH